MFCSDLNTIKTEGLFKRYLKRVEFKNVQNQGKVGILSTETAKPKFKEIRQKSIFGPTLTFLTSKFLEEQGLSDKFSKTSVAIIFKFAIINLANFKIVAPLV